MALGQISHTVSTYDSGVGIPMSGPPPADLRSTRIVLGMGEMPI